MPPDPFSAMLQDQPMPGDATGVGPMQGGMAPGGAPPTEILLQALMERLAGMPPEILQMLLQQLDQMGPAPGGAPGMGAGAPPLPAPGGPPLAPPPY
jgi:hypothetical protein